MADEEKALPKKLAGILDSISELSILEVSELVKAMEEKFGVSAAAPMMAMPAGGAAAAVAAAPAEEKTIFDVILTSAGETKINVIKAVREVTTLGLKEAKDLVDGAPKTVKEGVKKEEAEAMKAKIEGAGGKVELK